MATICPNITKPVNMTLRAARGNYLLNKRLLSLYKKYCGGPELPDVEPIPKDKDSRFSDEDIKGLGSVCIIGAGVAGLYAAMLLVTAGVTDFTILEASDRIGGRAYSFEFPKDSTCNHNYYDMGAMRIPCIPGMQPTFDLLDVLGIKPQEYVYNTKVPDMYFYTQYTDQSTEPGDQPFKDRMNWLLDTYGFSAATTPAELEAAFKAYFSDTHNWDNYSCRNWMMITFSEIKNMPRALTYEETEYAEMKETSSGLLDQALTEMMIDYSDFQAADNKDWKRVEGPSVTDASVLTGMSHLTDSMVDYIKARGGPTIQTKCPVVSMSDTGNNTIEVVYGSTVASRQSASFDHVVCTTPMGCLQRMDLSGLNLSNEVLMGIKTLAYDRASKVAIKFKQRWWMDTGIITTTGGVSSTDLPISNVVYPSWDDGDANESYILMASYSWAQDATRIGSLIPDYQNKDLTNPDDPILILCLENLSKLFKDSPSYDDLIRKYVNHHAWSWSHDPWTAGAFALFGPGQFTNIYQNYFTDWLVGGKLLLAGEALSVHHAWISGAIDSVTIKVMQLVMDKLSPKAIQKIKGSPLGASGLVDEKYLHYSVKVAQARRNKSS